MSWTTAVWSMLASACMTFAVLHLPVWLRDRRALPNLYFALVCIATAGMLLTEVGMMHASSPQEYAAVLRWRHVPVWLCVVAVVGFLHVYLGTGRLWLAWSVVGLRTAALVINFTTGVNANFLEIRELGTIDFLGEQVAHPIGVPNPWMVLAQGSAWLCVAYIADAAFTGWRRGIRGGSLRLALAILVFMAAGTFQGTVIVWLGLRLPTASGLFIIGVVAAMAHELSRNLWRAGHLAEELRESERRMALAAGAAKLGMWDRDLVRGEAWANPQWRELVGFGPAEAVSLGRLIDKVHPDDRERVRRALTETTGPLSVHEIEFRVLRPDGDVRWIASRGHVEFDALGRPARALGASVDCTARKKSEQETSLLRQEITHVGRVSVMGQLASGLAHELNQPLGAILRNAEAASLFLRAERPDLDEIRAILEDIRKDDQRAGAVIDRMRSLLRRHVVEMRPLAVEELVGDVASLLRPEAAARRVRLELAVAGDLPPVAGDRVHLQQVLLNLVANGMDAIDEAAGPGRSIVVSARADGSRGVEIAVSDSGRGLAAGDVQRLFEPFFTTKAKGMGMGLSISRTIVEAHGGKLWAEHQEGGGARFLFTVPGMPATAEAAP